MSDDTYKRPAPAADDFAAIAARLKEIEAAEKRPQQPQPAEVAWEYLG